MQQFINRKTLGGDVNPNLCDRSEAYKEECNRPSFAHSLGTPGMLLIKILCYGYAASACTPLHSVPLYRPNSLEG